MLLYLTIVAVKGILSITEEAKADTQSTKMMATTKRWSSGTTWNWQRLNHNLDEMLCHSHKHAHTHALHGIITLSSQFQFIIIYYSFRLWDRKSILKNIYGYIHSGCRRCIHIKYHPCQIMTRFLDTADAGMQSLALNSKWKYYSLFYLSN